MMNERKKWIKALNQLWSENYRVSQFYRRATGATSDKILKATLIRLSTKRAQFTFEIGQRLKELGGETYPHKRVENNSSTIIPLNLTRESTERILNKSLGLERQSIQGYFRALAVVNDGPTREILIRHKAGISQMIRELQNIHPLHLIPGKDETLKTN